MPDDNQATAAKAAQEPEPIIEVDPNEPDPAKAITRSYKPADADIAAAARDRGGDGAGSTQVDPNDPLMKSREVRRRLSRMARNYDQRLADQEARHRQEMADMRKELDAIKLERNEDTSKLDTEHEREMAGLQEKLAAAIEKGDSGEQARLQVAITRAENTYWAKKQHLATGTKPVQRDDQRQQQQQRDQPTRQGPTAAGARFITANEDWWEDDEFKLERNYANQIFADLTKNEGYDANDDDTFREIARRVKTKFPSLDVKPGRAEAGDDAGDGEGKTGTKPIVKNGALNAQDRGGQQPRGRGRITLTQADIATMRTTRLDPMNNTHVMQYMREKQAMEATSGGRG